MYYNASSTSISRVPTDKALLKVLDREIAHAYHPSGRGYVEESLLATKAGTTIPVIRASVRELQQAGVIESYRQVECCGEAQDPADLKCADCGRALKGATPTGITCYRVKVRPLEPASDPSKQPQQPEAFISYRRVDSKTLAADIYYSLMAEGMSVFLDTGDIPVGAIPEEVFLKAASAARCFICLVSKDYFGSEYCKKEIAHAARAGRRLIRINVPPTPPAPPDLPWFDGPNWVSQPGAGTGLDPTLERLLITAVQPTATVVPVADLRREACQFLMNLMPPGEINRLWTKLSWMDEFTPANQKSENVRQILQEATGNRLQLLCNALAP